MISLQNIIIITIGFLLSQVLIAAKVHVRVIGYVLGHSRTTTGGLLTAALLLSYGLSVFFSNTVVILAMLPVVKKLMSVFTDQQNRKILAALFYCALVFGANTGGMASLTSSFLNVYTTEIAHSQSLPGSEHLTFFSWLLGGIPASLAIVLAGRWILISNIPEGLEPSRLPSQKKTAQFPFVRPLSFFLTNVGITIVLSASQFIFKPAPVFGSLNIIDILFIVYLAVFVSFSFIYPRKVRTPENVLKNIFFLLLFTIAFPVIFLSKTLEQLEARLRIPVGDICKVLDGRLLGMINYCWQGLFRERFATLSIYNSNSVLSINRIMLEIPWFGLFLMAVTVIFLLFLIHVGDNPATPGIDGWLFTILAEAGEILTSLSVSPPLLFGGISLFTIFATEILNNTTVVSVLAAVILNLQSAVAHEQLFLLLLVAVSASCAFMSPIATPVNALAFGGFEKLSIRTIIKLGLYMNLAAALLITSFFLLLFFFL